MGAVGVIITVVIIAIVIIIITLLLSLPLSLLLLSSDQWPLEVSGKTQWRPWSATVEPPALE